MFTTGSKLLLGSTVAALIGTLLYGILVGGIMGTVGLVSATAALGTFAAINIFTWPPPRSRSDSSPTRRSSCLA
jgi:hypothetical protein